jgi:hypothetical protein
MVESATEIKGNLLVECWQGHQSLELNVSGLIREKTYGLEWKFDEDPSEVTGSGIVRFRATDFLLFACMKG